jgi:predicted TIM-barrel fold metal-dependent hydrolase
LRAWRLSLERVARQHNVAIKISGLGHPDLPALANGPIIRDTISIFGVDGCMFASNFPVDSLIGSFDTIYDGFFAAIAGRSLADHHKLFHDNAIRLYRL